MTLIDLIDQKDGFFTRPKTVSEVTRGKSETIKVSDFYEIVDAIASRNENETVQIEGTHIIPPNFYSAANFAKRGQWVVLRTFGGNAARLRENRWSELKARIEANETYKRTDGPFIGWAWKDPRGNHHVVRPSVDLEGHKLEFYAATQTNIHDKIKVYSAKNSPRNTILVGVPSRSSDETHQVVIENVPRVRDDEKFVSWTMVNSRHDCDFKRNDFTFRIGGDIKTYCPHDVAAYLAYSRRALAATGEIIPQIFPRFSEAILRLYTGAANHTLIVDEFRKEGKKRHRTRPLSFPEIDALLMDAWLAYGNKQTFFLRDMKREYKTGPPIGQRVPMRKYDWSTNAPGMPFGNN